MNAQHLSIDELADAVEGLLDLQSRWLDTGHRPDGVRGRGAVGWPLSGAITLRFASE
jgi:hypothetical protein